MQFYGVVEIVFKNKFPDRCLLATLVKMAAYLFIFYPKYPDVVLLWNILASPSFTL